MNPIDPFVYTLLRAICVTFIASVLFLGILRFSRGLVPTVHRSVWFGILLLGLCVFQFTVNVPYYEAPQRVVVNTEVASPEPLRFERMFAPVIPRGSTNMLQSTAPISTPSTAKSFTINWWTVCVCVWGGGIGLLLVRRLVLFVKLVRYVSTTTPAHKNQWSNMLSEFGIAEQKIPICWTENTGPALVRSLFGYRLVFPESLWDSLTEKQREGVLRHELSHYLGRDAFWSELARLLVYVQWFNPAVWLALRKFEEATEWKCDDFAYFNRKNGPKELIKTLLVVHDSTETLRLHLSSFAKISVLTRIQRLLNNQPQENSTMKKTLVFTLFALLLFGSVTRIQLVAKAEKETDDPATVASTDTKWPAIDPKTKAELERLAKMGESMITMKDISVERLNDVLGDIDERSYKIEEKDFKKKIFKLKVKICDKILASNPDNETLDRILYRKLLSLNELIYLDWSLENIAELEEYGNGLKTEGTEASYRENAMSFAKRAKLFRFSRIDGLTAEDYFQARKEALDYIKGDEIDWNKTNLGRTITETATFLADTGILTKEQLVESYEQVIASLKNLKPPKESNDEYKMYIANEREELEIGLVLITIEGKPFAFTGTDVNDKAFDSASLRGKYVLATFTSSAFGGAEMGDMLELNNDFAGKDLDMVTYISLSEKESHIDKIWLDSLLKETKYPGTTLTKIESNEFVIQKISELSSDYQYHYLRNMFLLIGKDGSVISFGRVGQTAKKLEELFGPPQGTPESRAEIVRQFENVPKLCASNLQKIMLAMHCYHDVYRTFPPAYTVDENGNKLHSWRVLLLPFLEQQALYDAIKLDEPWNSESNRKARETIVPVYQCHKTGLSTGLSPNRGPTTDYAAVIGREAAFEENGKSVVISDFTDGTSNTIVFVERATPILWMQPDDITFEEACKGIGVSPQGIANAHEAGSHAAVCDGSTRFLPNDVAPKTLRAILTRNGGESVALPE